MGLGEGACGSGSEQSDEELDGCGRHLWCWTEGLVFVSKEKVR